MFGAPPFTPPSTKKKRKKPVQLTAKSLKWLRERGYEVDKTEHWISHAKPPRRKDLFGIIDIVALKAGEGTIGIQVTSQDNASSRIKKILAEPRTALLFRCGWKIQVHGWCKLAGKWGVHVTDVGAMPWTK